MGSILYTIICLMVGAAFLAPLILWPLFTLHPRDRAIGAVLGLILLTIGVVRASGWFKKKKKTGAEAAPAAAVSAAPNAHAGLLDKIESGKISSQFRLKELAVSPQVPVSVRNAAWERLTDQELLKGIAKTNAGGRACDALKKIDDQIFLAEAVRGIYPGINDVAKEEAVRRITDPDRLAALGASLSGCRNPSLSRAWLEAATAAAESNPDLMLKVSGTARQMIRNAHTDTQIVVGNRHDDGWQRVPHMSSDCHEDHTPWTQAKGPWGEWGWHGDGTSGGTKQHQDTNPLSNWQKRYPG